MSDHGVEPVVTHDVGGAAAEGAPNLTRGRPECNNWAYTGRCAYADDCRFEHIGEEHAKGTISAVGAINTGQGKASVRKGERDAVQECGCKAH